jgi:TonB family protein
MKPLIFLISLLGHALFLLLLVTIRFPVPDSVATPRIIQIVPMSPPPVVARPVPEPRLVYVRPFVLRGGGPVAHRRAPSAKGALPSAASPAAADRASAASPSSGSLDAPLQHMPEAALPLDGNLQPAAGSKRLAIDLGRIAKRLKPQGPSGKAGTGSRLSARGEEGLPFGDAPPMEGSFSGTGGNALPGSDGAVPGGGDGTASHALAGNAFFDSRGYDITPWAKRMVFRVKKNWIFPPATAYGPKGTVGIYVLIERDGSIGQVYIRKASGIRPFDQAAFNAIGLSAPLPPLPDDFPYDDLPAYLLFRYN